MFDYCFKIYTDVTVLYDNNDDQLWYLFSSKWLNNVIENMLDVKWCLLNYKSRYFTNQYLKNLLNFRIKEKDKIFKIEYYEELRTDIGTIDHVDKI